MKYFAGIGSRKTPEKILEQMTLNSTKYIDMGFILRSGGAYGADKVYEVGVPLNAPKEIFRPSDKIPDEAFILAEHYHPAWHRCNTYARRCHARNCLIILGIDLETPVEFVECWTPNGEIAGGTGQALRIALDWDIPIFNLAGTGGGYGDNRNKQMEQTNHHN
jgi:hypothetical protein